jgi:hypothetical protein
MGTSRPPLVGGGTAALRVPKKISQRAVLGAHWAVVLYWAAYVAFFAYTFLLITFRAVDGELAGRYLIFLQPWTDFVAKAVPAVDAARRLNSAAFRSGSGCLPTFSP